MKKFLSPFLIAAILLGFSFSSVFTRLSDAAEDGLAVEKSGNYQAGISVEVIERIPLPKGYHEGLFLNGSDIWVNNGKNINTWIISAEGDAVGEIVPPGTFTEGLTDSSVPGKFWVTDWDTKKLYRASIENGRMLPDMEISVAPALPTGVIRAGNMLYVMTWTRGLGTKYHLLQFNEDGEILRKARIKGISEPSQITWDGRYLWITSWFSQKVYQVDPQELIVMGYFKSPAKAATGIAWDGEYFWITGTHDDLYKIKVGK